jgi:glutamyl-tRNA(Gln) amidotransferase subunit E
MYPDTDSPPNRITREHVDGLKSKLPEPPWVREDRYSKAGVPRDTIFYLIRRGGARLVDLVAARCGTPVREACFFFGEKIKGLRRSGVDVDGITDRAWCEFFELTSANQAIMEAWKRIVEEMAREPEQTPGEIIAEMGLGTPPEAWSNGLNNIVETRKPDHPDGSADQRFRFFMGVAMDELRGRVRAVEVASVLRGTLEGK